MSAPTIVFTATARRDLAAIHADIALHAGRRTAQRWLADLERRAFSLAEHPLKGMLDDTLGAGRRRLVVHPYLIVYRVRADDRVDVLRIVHGARDLSSMIGEPNRD